MFVMSDDTSDQQAVLKTMGIGGGGGNTVAHMLKQGHDQNGLEFIIANTDQQALRDEGDYGLAIGAGLTKGLGAGAKPDVGRQAAEESEGEIRKRLEGADMLFLTAGMGGGTGTGGIPVIARIARDMGILTIAIVTRPFSFEGPKRKRLADEGIAQLEEHVDSLITIPNDKLVPVLGKNASLLTAFDAVNDVLRDAVLGISEMITAPGMINVDFADVRTVMSNQGFAKIGTGTATGENRAEEAALEAINSPLLDDIRVDGAKGLLVNISAGPDLSIGEFNAVGEALRDYVGDEATVVIGTSLNMDKSDDIQVSVVATGLGELTKPAPGKPIAQPKPMTSDPKERQNPPQAAQEDIKIKEAQRRFQQRQETTPKSTPGRQQRSSNLAVDEDYLDIPAFLRRPTK